MGLISVYHTWTDGYIPMGLINSDRLNTNYSRLYTEINGLLDEANIENPSRVMVNDRNYTGASSTTAISGNWIHSGTITFSGVITHTNYTALNACNELRFYDTDSSNYVGFEAPGTVSANKIWVLPSADGVANSVLKTDGSGNLGFTSFALTASCLWEEYTVEAEAVVISEGIVYDLTSASYTIPAVVIHGPCDEAAGTSYLLVFSTPNYAYTTPAYSHYISISNEGEVNGAQSDKLVIGSTSQEGVPIEAITIHGRILAASQTRIDLESTTMSGILALASGPPDTAASAGIAGTITYDASFIYVCVATNTWKRAALSTWA